ncbi:hypothetical protein QQ045_019540 [Rhodiola kirilowii]
MRRVQSRVNLIVDEDSVVATSEQTGAEAVDFYSKLLTWHNPPHPVHAFGYFDKVITDDENDELSRCPTGDEIIKEFKSMSDDSAPGPDGFTARFFVFFWELIKADVVKGVSGFFFGLQIPKIIGGTYLTLILKAPNPTSIADLWPISLCNVVHKIFSKLLNSRLSHVLHKLVSPEQVGFVKGRSILENIALGHDLLFDFKEKTESGNIMIKLDMSKAYDRMSWSFILALVAAKSLSISFLDAYLVRGSLLNGMAGIMGILNPLKGCGRVILCRPRFSLLPWSGSPRILIMRLVRVLSRDTILALVEGPLLPSCLLMISSYSLMGARNQLKTLWLSFKTFVITLARS